MSRICSICGKKAGVGNNVSHSHRKTKRRWQPNLQKIRIGAGSTPKKAYVCTSCIKSGKAVKL
jgi:large subunit ribosomal protein L28